MIETIINFMSGLITVFNNYAKDNQMIAGAISLWGLGVLSYLGRNVPKRIWESVLKQSTTEMTLMSSSQAFYNFLTWFHRQGYANRTRSMKITSGRWGEDSTFLKSIGYGSHYLFYKYIPFKIHMAKAENTHSLMERDELIITKLGRSHKFFDKLFGEIQDIISQEDKIQVYKWNTDYWQEASGQMKRELDTVFLETSVKNAVTGHIDNFLEKENWHITNGLSYQTGILLYGYPGCGKTSFIKALTSRYNKDLYILSSGQLHYVEKAIMKLPDNSLLLIEDIDADPALHERSVTKKDTSNLISSSDIAVSNTAHQFTLTNISDVLNSLDGIISVHGRILIATTNHIEKLDAALLRNGRFDLKVEIGYASLFIVKGFFGRYYPNFTINSDFMIKDKTSSSKIQNLILKNLDDPEKVLKEIALNEK